jgi:hypothetical protein
MATFNLPRGANQAQRIPWLAACVIAVCGQAPIAQGQAGLPETAAARALPEPIYWKQELFLVPYRWDSAFESGAVQAVWLIVSKDRGATWQKISEARPNVTSFSYRADGDGEYWFAVRTIDKLGRAWPASEYQPELRVIVDTAMPQISGLSAWQRADGAIEILCVASDSNLDPSSLKVEALMDSVGTWQSVPIELADQGQGPGGNQQAPAPPASLCAFWRPPAGSRPLAIRATILDLGGNEATFQSSISYGGTGSFFTNQAAPMFPAPTSIPSEQRPGAGWVSGSAATAAQLPVAAASQHWPAIAVDRAPFRLFTSTTSLPDDGITAYGNPAAGGSTAIGEGVIESNEQRVAAQYAGAVLAGESQVAAGAHAGPGVTPLEPFRHASLKRLPAASPLQANPAAAAPADSQLPQPAPPAQPKLVGSRTFALEYDLDDAGRWGVTNVELWGTRDGGRTWLRYGRDDDLRSPFVVTVDEEGAYGFRIVVESAGSAAQPPRAGELPELWVAVDLHRPTIELIGLARGTGNLADHLILRWQAVDDNLEPRPISLFYSSRASGPWSAIATHLENTGEYAWRVERHVPERFYLRAETRDAAGNLAAFQTREPIEFDGLAPAVELRHGESAGATATGLGESYR